MANGEKMARSEAARKADQRYKAEKTKQLVIRFYPADADMLEHLQKQDSKQGYIKRLIREDMGAWYEPTTHEVECRACGYTTTIEDARRHAECPRCHGQV